MSIAACALIITLAVFLNSFEFSSQFKTPLRELFPGCEGHIFPTLKILRYQKNTNLSNLRKLDDEYFKKFDEFSTLVKRGPLIIGWRAGDWIKPIYPKGGNYGTCYVFNIETNHFLTLFHADYHKLGVNQRIPDVLGADQIMAVRFKKQQAMQRECKSSDEYANKEAAELANTQASFESHVQARKPNQSQEARALAIGQAYRQTYDRAFSEDQRQYYRQQQKFD